MSQSQDPEEPTGLPAARVALLAAAAGYATLVAYQAFTLPDRVPGQVGISGEVTWWADRSTHVLLAALTGLGLFLLFWFLPRLIGALPQGALNLPHKDYWLKPDNLPRAQRMIADDLGWFGAATLAFVGYALFELGRVAVAGTGFGAGFWVLLATYLVGSLAWAIWNTIGPRWKPRHTL